MNRSLSKYKLRARSWAEVYTRRESFLHNKWIGPLSGLQTGFWRSPGQLDQRGSGWVRAVGKGWRVKDEGWRAVTGGRMIGQVIWKRRPMRASPREHLSHGASCSHISPFLSWDRILLCLSVLGKSAVHSGFMVMILESVSQVIIVHSENKQHREWTAASEGYMESSACVLSCFRPIRLFETPWTLACQTPLSTGFSRQKYWSGLSCLPPGDLPGPGIKPISLMSICIGWQVLYHLSHQRNPWKAEWWQKSRKTKTFKEGAEGGMWSLFLPWEFSVMLEKLRSFGQGVDMNLSKFQVMVKDGEA